MRWQAPIRILTMTALAFAVTVPVFSALNHNRKINLVTTDYDLVDTSYIDRGRMDGIRVGDSFDVNMRSGKMVTKVIVTAVYDRMAAVKIKDSWLLKDGLRATASQRPYKQKFNAMERRPAPDIPIKAAAKISSATVPAPAAPAPAPAALPTADAPGLPPTDLPAMPGESAVPDLLGEPLPDMGGLPDMPGDDMGPLPSDGDMGMPPMDGGMDLPAMDGDMSLPPMDGDMGLPPMDGDMGFPDAGMDVPPPPDF